MELLKLQLFPHSWFLTLGFLLLIKALFCVVFTLLAHLRPSCCLIPPFLDELKFYSIWIWSWSAQ